MPEKSPDLFGSISIDDKKNESAPEKKPPVPSRKKKKSVPPPKKSRQQRSSIGGWPKFFILLVVLAAIYSAAGFLLVPYLARTTLPEYLAQKLKVHVTVGETQFNPFTFKLATEGLVVETNEPGAAPGQLFSTGKTRIDFDLLPLLRGDLVCSTMDIDRLNIKIIRTNDKDYNISYLFQGTGIKNHSEIMDFAELPFLFSLNNIKITDSQIIFDDKSTGKIHHVEKMEIALPALSNFQYQTDNYIHPQFSAVINGSPVKLSGETSIGSSREDGRQTLLSCDLDDIDIPLYFDYLPISMPVDVSRGKANGSLHISFASEQQPGSKLKIQFNISATDLGVESRNNKLTVSIPNAKLEGSLEPFNHNLDIQNIILREPILTSDGIVTRDTLANLVPLTQRPNQEDPLHQVIPEISVKLLIADGGSIVIKKPKEKKPLRIWHSIQLNIKNFSNSVKTPDQQDSTFRVSGEHLASSAFFTWQGQFNKQNRPSGNLQLSNMPASVVAPFLAKEAKDIKGTADLTGLLGISLSSKENKPFDYTLKSTKISIKDLHLSDKGVEWIHIPDLRCEPISIINNITDLGNVYMQNSYATIYRENIPELLKNFTVRPSSLVIHGIDFSGTVQVKEKNNKVPVIKIGNVILQANKLEQQEINEENFVFSGTVSDGGTIKAKGILQTSPLQIASQLSFAKLSPEQIFPWFTDIPTLKESKATLAAQGTFRYPQKEFNGKLEVEQLAIGHIKNPVLRAANVTFDDFFWSLNDKKLSIKYILVDQPEFSWNITEKSLNPITPVSIFLRHIFLPEPDTASSDPDNSLADFSLSIDKIDYSDGSVSYQDSRVLPPLALGITGINGNLGNLQYPIAKMKADFDLTGNIEGYPFKLNGNGMLMQYPPSAKTVFAAQNLPLSLFSRQLAEQNSFDTTKAHVSVVSASIFEDKESRRDTKLTISSILPARYNSPASTALALMADTAGNLNIRLQADNSTTIKPLISDVLGNVNRSLVKATINPILITGDDFSDLVSNQHISFFPGTTEITGEGTERLNRFGEFLAHYPLIKLRLTGYADTTIDTPAIYKDLQDIERQRVELENSKRKEAWQKLKDAEDALRRGASAADGEQIQEADLPLTTVEPYVPVAPNTIIVTDSMLVDLAVKREQLVYDYFTNRLSVKEARIEKDTSEKNSTQKDGRHAIVQIGISDMYRATEN